MSTKFGIFTKRRPATGEMMSSQEINTLAQLK